MPLFRRCGRPGLLGTVSRTAVIAGTATVTARAVDHGMTRLQMTGQAIAADQSQRASPQVDSPASVTEQLSTLSALNASGALSDAEFARAKNLLLFGH